MKTNYSVVLEKRDGVYFCSIPTLKLVSQSESLTEAYEKIELLKNERLNSNNRFDNFEADTPGRKKTLEDYLKLAITIVFFVLLTAGAATHIFVYLMGSMNHRVDRITSNLKEKLDLPKTLSSISQLTPEEKVAKVKRFEVKIQNAQKLLIEYKPFIEASKPLLRDIQKSFDLKQPGQ